MEKKKRDKEMYIRRERTSEDTEMDEMVRGRRERKEAKEEWGSVGMGIETDGREGLGWKREGGRQDQGPRQKLNDL